MDQDFRDNQHQHRGQQEQQYLLNLRSLKKRKHQKKRMVLEVLWLQVAKMRKREVTNHAPI
ncbi:unnamed protein product [Onchocerca flexuosa]|uniref:Ovule protein n=1 Tax=Onchocerca flexuosa TaxID=387005 RepID=A0A183HEI1_9BILA|nr:unnamed protein product [Onchocerca flexuosa]